MSIEKLSIRARVAFGILCLEVFLNHLSYDIKEWKLILDELWKYTNSNVGKWHEEMSEMTPFSICEKIPFLEKGCEYINEEKHNYLQELFEKSNLNTLQIIDLIFQIGTRDLYSSIVNGSQDTIKYLQEIIHLLEDNNIPLPNIKLLGNYSINENNGWGKEFRREDIFGNNEGLSVS